MTFPLIFAVIATYAGLWKIFEKANRPGWAVLVPFYNALLVLRMIDRPHWWLILLFVPGVNLVIAVLVLLELAERFGKGMAYGAGLALLPFVFLPMLGYGEARFHAVE